MNTNVGCDAKSKTLQFGVDSDEEHLPGVKARNGFVAGFANCQRVPYQLYLGKVQPLKGSLRMKGKPLLSELRVEISGHDSLPCAGD